MGVLVLGVLELKVLIHECSCVLVVLELELGILD